MPANPCSSKTPASVSSTVASTNRCAGRNSGKPLSGVGLAISQAPGDLVDGSVVDEVEQERVGDPLAADRGLLPVAGQHDDVVRERQHLLPQTAQHRRVVTAGK